MRAKKQKYAAINGLFVNRSVSLRNRRDFQKFLLSKGNGNVYFSFLIRISLPGMKKECYDSLAYSTVKNIIINAFCWAAQTHAEVDANRLLPDNVGWFDIHEEWQNILKNKHEEEVF